MDLSSIKNLSKNQPMIKSGAVNAPQAQGVASSQVISTDEAPLPNFRKLPERAVFFVSDQTAITAQTLGKALLTQFEGVEFVTALLPFVNTLEIAAETNKLIDEAAEKYSTRPIVFCTFTNHEIKQELAKSNCVVHDFFQSYILPLENELGLKSNHATGKSHGQISESSYLSRIDCINFALYNDDGGSHKQYNQAEVILVGVSRTGKTPTSLYLALQFGILAANYPLTTENFEFDGLPAALKPYKQKLVGLTLEPTRLHHIRSERRPSEEYSGLEKCRYEVRKSIELFDGLGIPYLDTTSISIEEISSTILKLTHLNLTKA